MTRVMEVDPRQAVYGTGAYPGNVVPMTVPGGNINVFDNKPIDTSQDGLFNIWDAGKYFVKGVFSPITEMIKHPIRSMIMIGVSSAILLACPPLLPVFMAGGALMGGAQMFYSGAKFVSHWQDGNYDAMEKDFETLGAGTSALGMTLLGIRQYYKSLGFGKGVAQCFKDSGLLIREILTTMKMPQQHTVVLLNTTNQQKARDLSAYFDKTGKGKVSTIQVDGSKPDKTQLVARALSENESQYGKTYLEIAAGKASEHTADEILTARLQNLTSPTEEMALKAGLKDAKDLPDLSPLNGKTLEEAFPGRRILIIADDSGLEMPLPLSKIGELRTQLQSRGLSADDAETFLQVSADQAKPGLRPIDGKEMIDILGEKTHPNLNFIAEKMNFRNADGSLSTHQAEEFLVSIMQQINPGGEMSFNSAVAVRNIYSTSPSGSFQQVKGIIADEAVPAGTANSDNTPLARTMKLVDGHQEVKGDYLATAEREYLPRTQAAFASLEALHNAGMGQFAFFSTTNGNNLQKVLG